MGLEHLPTFINELMANVGKYSMTWHMGNIISNVTLVPLSFYICDHICRLFLLGWSCSIFWRVKMCKSNIVWNKNDVTDLLEGFLVSTSPLTVTLLGT